MKTSWRSSTLITSIWKRQRPQQVETSVNKVEFYAPLPVVPGTPEPLVDDRKTFPILDLPRELRDLIYEHYFELEHTPAGRLTFPFSSSLITNILRVSQQISYEAHEVLSLRYVIELQEYPGVTTLQRQQVSRLRMSIELPLRDKWPFYETLYDLRHHFMSHLYEYERLRALADSKKHHGYASSVRKWNAQVDEAMRRAKKRLLYQHFGIDKDASAADIEIIEEYKHYRLTDGSGEVVDVHMPLPSVSPLEILPKWIKFEGHLALIGHLWVKGSMAAAAIAPIIKTSVQSGELDTLLDRLGFDRPNHVLFTHNMMKSRDSASNEVLRIEEWKTK